MNPFEVERLGWDHIRGLPVVPDAEIGTGRFDRLLARLDGEGLEETEAIGQEIETLVPTSNYDLSQWFAGMQVGGRARGTRRAERPSVRRRSSSPPSGRQ